MLDNPLVSIVLPSYNQGRYLSATLDSIFAQDYRPLEVIVVDGASSDDTVDILRRYANSHPELRWVSEPDEGVADAVNKGLAMASGPLAAIQSSDDIYRPGAIGEAAAYLGQHPEVGIVCADIDMIDADGRPLWMPSSAPFSLASFLSRSTIIHQSSTFFRLELVLQAGGWDASYYCCDSELWLRLAFRTRIVKLDRIWSAWRRHEEQRDKAARRMWEDWGRMIRTSADVRAAPWRLRLAASAGRRLLAQSYNPQNSRLFLLRQVWAALLTYPPALRGIHPKSVLIPGAGRLAAALRRCRARQAK